MKKINQLKILALIMVTIPLLTACNVSSTGKDTAKKAKTAQVVKKPKFKDTPTLYFHGLMGSYKNEEPLVNAAKKAQKSNSVIRANVDENGKVKLKGTIKRMLKILL